jgi:prolyl 4-hydroxylase
VQALLPLALPHLSESKVDGGLSTYNRTSTSMFLTGRDSCSCAALVLEQRLQALLDVAAAAVGRRPLVMTEATQITRYMPGQFYGYHYDNGGVNGVESSGKSRRLNRAATAMVYLNDCHVGGETAFPRAQHTSPADFASNDVHQTADMLRGSLKPTHSSDRVEEVPALGVRIVPKRGRAVVFWSTQADGAPDDAALHAALRVGRGVKWVATRWCCEAPS